MPSTNWEPTKTTSKAATSAPIPIIGRVNSAIERRERKLLLQKKELVKLERKTKESGLTIVPVRLFLNEKGFAKLRIALARGKKEYDKRETLKQKDAKREMDRYMKK